MVFAISFSIKRLPVSLSFPAVVGTSTGPDLSLRVWGAASGTVAAGVLPICTVNRNIEITETLRFARAQECKTSIFWYLMKCCDWVLLSSADQYETSSLLLVGHSLASLYPALFPVPSHDPGPDSWRLAAGPCGSVVPAGHPCERTRWMESGVVWTMPGSGCSPCCCCASALEAASVEGAGT